MVSSVSARVVGVPLQRGLSQNYPNPFNPTTTIAYTVGGVRGQGLGASEVRLVVFDLLGREIAVLVNEVKAPGTYMVRFDASRLASGVYFCRMKTGGFSQSKSMILTK